MRALSVILTFVQFGASFGFSNQHLIRLRHGWLASTMNLALHVVPAATSASETEYTIRDSWSLVVLGDLHMEDDMSTHEQARGDCVAAIKDFSLIPTPPPFQDVAIEDRPSVRHMVEEAEKMNAGDLSISQLELLLSRKKDGDLMRSYLVSLGDLGRKDIRHEQGDPGTTKSFLEAKNFLDGFEGIPYDLVTGNHDLEGLDEFATDEANLQAWMRCFGKDKPYFCRRIGDKTVIVGLSTVRFRDAPFSSHEVHIDDAQLEWFTRTVQSYPADEGWKVLVFSHAPIMGSGLRHLQNVHVTNGCAWLNHCSSNRNTFIRLVQECPQIKLWFSGHFHLSHDYEDSISTVGCCTFVQVGVMGPVSSRDGRRQSRLVLGCSDRLRVYTINHHLRDDINKANVRLDVDIDILTGKVQFAHANQDADRQDWFQAYVPRLQDGCYIESPDGSVADAGSLDAKVCWWHMADGKVLGLHRGQLVEYDAETLSPLGIVVNQKALGDREVLVVENGTALVLVDERTKHVEVVHPNEDGSYWRKFQRNKRIRLEEKAREAIAKMWLEKNARTT